MTDDLQQYVIQVRELAVPVDDLDNFERDGAEAQRAWFDVAVVTVPPKTKRKTALLRGLQKAGIELTDDLEARALDDDASYIWRARPPEPKALRLS